MERTNKHYTNEEDKVIIDCVKRNPQNLTEAFKKAERLLETRSFNSISNRWYQKLSRNYDNRCFFTIGLKSKNSNRKVVRKDTYNNTVSITETIWKKILSLFK